MPLDLTSSYNSGTRASEPCIQLGCCPPPPTAASPTGCQQSTGPQQHNRLGVCTVSQLPQLRWLVDGGAAYDVIPADQVRNLRQYFSQDAAKVQVYTANGLVESAGAINLRMPSLDSDIPAIVLPETPALLSLGRRVMNDGCHFCWLSGQRPWLGFPDGSWLQLDVDGYLPYLPNSEALYLCNNPAHTALAAVGVEDHTSLACPAAGSAPADSLAPDAGAGSDQAALEYPEWVPPRRLRRTRTDPRSQQHLLTHLAKNPACPHC